MVNGLLLFWQQESKNNIIYKYKVYIFVMLYLQCLNAVWMIHILKVIHSDKMILE